MSRSIDLFIDAPVAIDRLAAEITNLTGHAFAEVEGRRGLVLSTGDAVAELPLTRVLPAGTSCASGGGWRGCSGWASTSCTLSVSVTAFRSSSIGGRRWSGPVRRTR